MLEASKPPILDTPISPYLDDHAFRSTSLPLHAGLLLTPESSRDGHKSRRETFPESDRLQVVASASGLQVFGGDRC